ncbi:MAG: tRNA (guanosine(46)-N7)-methyltransferase TrmB [Bacteroidia bacterium]
MNESKAFFIFAHSMPTKLEKFAEFNSLPNCVWLPFEEKDEGLAMRGKWRSDYFKNNNPIVLELGCGRGEYTVGLAQKHPDVNYIGADIKGNRIWTGAKYAVENNMKNVAFIRVMIDFIENCFTEEEVDEIWITFPDPQPQKTRIRKRLTSPRFLNNYFKFLKKDGLIHLKTDSTFFYEYTLETIAEMKLKLLYSTADLYDHNPAGLEELTQIQTHYEKLFSDKGEKIKYCCFQKQEG